MLSMFAIVAASVTSPLADLDGRGVPDFVIETRVRQEGSALIERKATVIAGEDFSSLINIVVEEVVSIEDPNALLRGWVIEDQSQDGTAEILVSSPPHGLRMFSGKNGADLTPELLHELGALDYATSLAVADTRAGVWICAYDRFRMLVAGPVRGSGGGDIREFPGAYSASFLGDLDADDTPELAVCTSYRDGGGDAMIVSGATGQRLFAYENRGDKIFGASVVAVGNIDGDRLPELAVGSLDAPGKVAIIVTADQEIIELYEGDAKGGHWDVGISLLALSCAGASRPAVLAIGTRDELTECGDDAWKHSSGAIHVVTRDAEGDWSLLRVMQGECGTTQFGKNLLVGIDFNGDRTAEIITTIQDENGSWAYCAVDAVSGNWLWRKDVMRG